MLGWPLAFFRYLADLLAYVGGLTLLLLSAATKFPAALIGRRARLGRSALAFQMVRVGVRAVPVVTVVSFSIGIILCLQLQPQLARFGADIETARVVSVGILRELGPLLSALILSGYSGAAVAAELGTMVVGEEIDALSAGAIDPMRFLVVPRVTATLVMVTALSVYADFIGLIGGYVTGVHLLRLNSNLFLATLVGAVTPSDFITGLSKSAVFGLIIGLVACREGLAVEGGAEGVGRATTRTVVVSGVSIIAVDTLMTGIFYAVGLY